MASKLAQIGLWIDARKFKLARTALLVFACALMVVAITMLMQVNNSMTRVQQLATQMISAEDKAEVLVLCSYDESDASTRMQRDGIVDVLEGSLVSVDVEYLDSAGSNGVYKTSYDLVNSSWGRALAQKIADHGGYSCVICIDDEALAYVDALRSSTFAKVPVVFTGVTNLSYATSAYEAGYATGLVETYDPQTIITTAQAMLPNARKVLAISDSTIEGEGLNSQLMNVADGFKGLQVNYLNASSISRSSLEKTLASTGKDTIVVYLSARSDNDSNSYTADQNAYFISAASKVPVFAVGFGGVGEGFAGSGYIDYVAEGKKAADVVVAVLNGTKTSDIALSGVSNEGTVFDQAVLSDYKLSESSLPSTAAVINQNGFSIDSIKNIVLPIVLLVFAVVCMLAYAYMGYRRTVSDISALVRERNFMEQRFYTDDLTDMPNMQWLTAFAGTSDAASVKSLAEIVLRDYDKIDEARGKGSADEIVKVLADRLDGLETVFLVRPAQDQFILGVDRKLEQGGALLEQVEYLLAQPVAVGGQFVNVDSNIAVFNREPGMSIEEMVSGVDVAAHQAEELGLEEEVIFYDGDMRAAVENKLEITAELKRQIDREAFNVLYQPQIELESNEVVGFEALVRMENDEFPAEVFIPVAEMSGQIADIDRIVAKKVVQQLSRWKKRKQRIRAMSINYSSGLHDEGYIDYVATMLAENDIPASTLRFDIKESSFISNMQKANDFISALQARGFNIAIDGFGVGYSSLSRLMQLPADVVKIDRGLSANSLSGNDAGVMANLVRLVHGANKVVVVQGIETADQLAKCREMGCDVVQGFYYSEPLLPERALQYKRAEPTIE